MNQPSQQSLLSQEQLGRLTTGPRPAQPRYGIAHAYAPHANDAMPVDYDEDEHPGPNFLSNANHAQRVASLRRPAVSTPLDTASKVVNSPEFRNQFSTGVSNGMYNPRARAEAEHRLFGYPHPIEDAHMEGSGRWDSMEERFTEDREGPIYGYMREHSSGDRLTAREQDVQSQYGRAVFNIKPEKLGDTTITYGDSLGLAATHAAGAYGAALPHSQVADREVVIDSDDFTPPFAERRRKVPTYTEAQFHGGLSIDDVQDIDIYEHKRPDFREADGWDIDHIKLAAQDAGIPYNQREYLGTTTQGQMFEPDGWDEMLAPRHFDGYENGVEHYRTTGQFDGVNRPQSVGDRMTSTDQFWSMKPRPRYGPDSMYKNFRGNMSDEELEF